MLRLVKQMHFWPSCVVISAEVIRREEIIEFDIAAAQLEWNEA